ncbi:hypothetical protein MMC10_010932 [Thelotrema lepadinum]|nr:hypothetical protein [Thelotrema lepadinum]
MDQTLLQRYDDLTKELGQSPYTAQLYVQRSTVCQELGYADLCIGDAYKALLLIDEAENQCDEYHEQALSALQYAHPAGRSGSLEDFIKLLLIDIYKNLVDSLMWCGCLESAREFCQQAIRRLPEEEVAQKISDLIHHWSNTPVSKDKACQNGHSELSELPNRGFVRREVYPWNHFMPDRYGEDYIRTLNEQLAGTTSTCCVKSVVLPALDGESTTRRQLGLFALEDIPPGKTILQETSLLTASIEPDDARCDACSAELPKLSENSTSFACDDCDDIFFCSNKCLEAAQESYHPAVCGTDVNALAEHIELQETPDALYGLLLARVFAMAETQDKHPLELKETRSLWGEFEQPPPTLKAAKTSLPFSFKFNILLPLHALQQMGVDIYATTARYDFWIINTLYAKFRGVASAKPNIRTGKLELCAVHPVWGLANHSCAPNVRWEWSGEMKLWARSGDEVVRWGQDKKAGDDEWKGGVRAGEEILSHYCDVDLPVHERREWMKGPLGGNCICERCTWEDAHRKCEA